MSATREPSVSTRSLFLELAAWGIPVDEYIEKYNLEKLSSPDAVELIKRARLDLEALETITASNDPNDEAVRAEGRA